MSLKFSFPREPSGIARHKNADKVVKAKIKAMAQLMRGDNIRKAVPHKQEGLDEDMEELDQMVVETYIEDGKNEGEELGEDDTTEDAAGEEDATQEAATQEATTIDEADPPSLIRRGGVYPPYMSGDETIFEARAARLMRVR